MHTLPSIITEVALRGIDRTYHLHSVFRLCHEVLPVMERQGSGVVINNASITAMRYIGKPHIAYASAKAAVIQFTKAAGCMYASKGIRLNAVVPGLMFTPLVENLGASDKEEDREVFRKITEHNVPMGAMGESIDVANAAVFLCSNAAKYITAHALVVDDGITAATGTGS
ncbi:putative short chain type dehydrogenase [Teratosphaeria destructans]|uniref:Short chain type dehydrogenase n=1 Tax=Teratosphaeria destructans TaxID=418781 RepID=A0A9W7SX43_9PEZI|nr:putative short chain type dehydrogenase [Teratosphaeria destructans]